MRTEKSLELTNRFDDVYPGAHSNFRAPIEPSAIRTFVTKAKGSRVWDVDGNEYIDFCLGAGPTIIGHGNEEYITTLKDYLDRLSPNMASGMFCTPADVELGEKIVQHVPCAEKVKYCTTGTEAVQVALRLARAFTGRRYFVRFEGHYHGWADNVLGGVVNKNLIEAIREGKKLHEKPLALESEEDLAGTAGRDPAAFEQSFLVPWNDIEVLEKVLELYGQEIAVVMMEPILCNHGCMPPLPGYLEQVRALCTRYGIVLYFDEVITGFRVALDGAQGLLGVTPDITTFGKAMAAGAPLSAVVGKMEIMDLFKSRQVLGPGTFMGFPFGIAASLATIRILEKENGVVYRNIARVQTRLMDGLREIGKRRSLPLLVQGPTGTFVSYFTNREVEVISKEEDMAHVNWDLVQNFYENIFQEGIAIFFGGRWFLSAATTDADVDKALEAADRVIAQF